MEVVTIVVVIYAWTDVIDGVMVLLVGEAYLGFGVVFVDDDRVVNDVG